MDRPVHERRLQADPFETRDRERALAETDPWGLDADESPEATAIPNSTHDIREVYLRSHSGVASSAGVSVLDRSWWLTSASRVWARVQSPFPLDRRVVAGLGLFGVACALLVGLSRYDFAPSIKTVSGTTYNTAVERLASAANAARDLVGIPAASPAPTNNLAAISRKSNVAPISRKNNVASISRSKVPNVTPTTGTRGPIDFSQGRYLMPPISTETLQANRRAPIGNAAVNATAGVNTTANINASAETRSKEALILPEDDSVVEASIVYSPDDADVSPPVIIRSPGIAATDFKNVASIEILVSETGRVESARGRQRPATLAGALESATALSVVKTWRFRPARRNGQPVKYRTTVSLVETLYPAGTTSGTR